MSGSGGNEPGNNRYYVEDIQRRGWGRTTLRGGGCGGGGGDGVWFFYEGFARGFYNIDSPFQLPESPFQLPESLAVGHTPQG